MEDHRFQHSDLHPRFNENLTTNIWPQLDLFFSAEYLPGKMLTRAQRPIYLFR